MTTEVQDKQISLKAMDDLIYNLKCVRELYKNQSDTAKATYEEVKQLEETIIELMSVAGKDRYIADGVQVSISHEMSVQTPKTPEDKNAFFAWLVANQGQEVADAYKTINSQSLNSLYNELTEEWARKGEVLVIDGLGEPIARTKLSMRKA